MENTIKDLFGLTEAPTPNTYQDTLHQIGELKKQIADLYRSIGNYSAAEAIFPPDNTADYDSIGQVG